MVVSLGACSLGDKQRVADRAIAARDVVTGPRAATVSLEIQPRKLNAAAASQATGALGGLYALGEGEVDSRKGTWALFAGDALAARINGLLGETNRVAPLLFADRTSLTVRRPAREVVAARGWYRLELKRVREVVKPRAAALLTSLNPSDLAVLTPTLIVDLLAGVLAGSVKERGHTITGRLSLDKANREDDLDDDAIEARRDALRLFAITDDVHDFRLRLADDGSIDRLAVTMLMKPDKQTRIELTWTMDVGERAPALRPPKIDDTVRISSFNQVRGAIEGWAA